MHASLIASFEPQRRAAKHRAGIYSEKGEGTYRPGSVSRPTSPSSALRGVYAAPVSLPPLLQEQKVYVHILSGLTCLKTRTFGVFHRDREELASGSRAEGTGLDDEPVDGFGAKVDVVADVVVVVMVTSTFIVGSDIPWAVAGKRRLKGCGKVEERKKKDASWSRSKWTARVEARRQPPASRLVQSLSDICLPYPFPSIPLSTTRHYRPCAT